MAMALEGCLLLHHLLPLGLHWLLYQACHPVIETQELVAWAQTTTACLARPSHLATTTIITVIRLAVVEVALCLTHMATGALQAAISVVCLLSTHLYLPLLRHHLMECTAWVLLMHTTLHHHHHLFLRHLTITTEGILTTAPYLDSMAALVG